jgi:hypothetical protein
VDSIVWNDPADKALLDKHLEDEDRCACTPLYFIPLEVTDEGPFVHNPDYVPPDDQEETA